MNVAKRAVLAFSGGLDTSAILTWMVKEQGWEVVTFTANLGQSGSDSLHLAEEKARSIGAIAHEVVDLRRELLEEFFLPALQAHAKLEGRYLLGTALARYPTARAAMAIARRYGATILAHGATGKGNDQVRFETTWLVLNADPAYHIENLEIYAPWKDEAFLQRFGSGGRTVMRAYLEKMGVPVPSGGSDQPDPYSQDENLLHISSEGVALEQPEVPHLGKVIYTRLTDPLRAPETPEFARVWFEHGVPVRLDVEDAAQFGLPERTEHHDLIKPVHEFRSELAASRFHTALADLLVDLVVEDFARGHALGFLRRTKTEARSHQGRHLRRAEVARHEDHGATEIDLAVVAERQRGLI